MRSPYRRKIKIQLVDDAQERDAHGWANVRNKETGAVCRRFFKADQVRFMTHLDQNGVSALRCQLEKMGVYPETITVVRGPNYTFTYHQLYNTPDRH